MENEEIVKRLNDLNERVEKLERSMYHKQADGNASPKTGLYFTN